jgi:hypothetical protein
MHTLWIEGLWPTYGRYAYGLNVSPLCVCMCAWAAMPQALGVAGVGVDATLHNVCV